jgi:hypothetical protein
MPDRVLSSKSIFHHPVYCIGTSTHVSTQGRCSFGDELAWENLMLANTRSGHVVVMAHMSKFTLHLWIRVTYRSIKLLISCRVRGQRSGTFVGAGEVLHPQA